MSIAFLEGAEYDYEAKRRPSRQDLEQRIAELTAALADAQAYNATLVNDLAKVQRRVNELEAENGSLQESLDGKGRGMWEVIDMKDRALEEYAQIVAELKTQLADGRTYAEGCKP